MWSSVATLICFELLATLRAPATLPERALELSVCVTMGLGIVPLKICCTETRRACTGIPRT